MRRILVALLLSLALPVAAQSTQPKDLQPIPEPPLLPAGIEKDAAFEPQVTITKRGEDKAEEFRIGGKLYMIKITPRGGVPYYLIDNRGDGTFARQESLDSGLRPPMWVIHQF